MYRTGRGIGTIHGWSTRVPTNTTARAQRLGLVFGARLHYWALLIAVVVAVVLS